MPTKKSITKKTVFISSTFLDLKKERKKVWDSLEKFDVIVKGMEQFGARKTDYRHIAKPQRYAQLFGDSATLNNLTKITL